MAFTCETSHSKSNAHVGAEPALSDRPQGEVEWMPSPARPRFARLLASRARPPGWVHPGLRVHFCFSTRSGSL